MILFIKRQFGTIIAFMLFFVLGLLTYGDVGDLFTKSYWDNVQENLLSIGMMSIVLTILQWAIKQSISGQALIKGLNTPKTISSFDKHKSYIRSQVSRMPYLPYFLEERNSRMTAKEKQKFLIDNGYKDEKNITKRHKKIYDKIKIDIKGKDIKWAYSKIIYNKNGTIENVQQFKMRKALWGLVISAFTMLAITLIARELFENITSETILKSTLQLLLYVATISATVPIDVVSHYQKSAVMVPEELEELNLIWIEFSRWEPTDEIVKEVNLSAEIQDYIKEIGKEEIKENV